MRTADFEFLLPANLIAQAPATERDGSRLFIVRRENGGFDHRRFREFPEFLRTDDLLVLNDSRVLPARLRGTNPKTGGKFEILLLEENSLNDWWVMLRPGRRARIGNEIILGRPDGDHTEVVATVTGTNTEGHRRLSFGGTANIARILDELGETPLPPYIARPGSKATREDRERYQTVYAQTDGSVAAPTAGLHFTRALLEQIRERGVTVCCVTLHVGLGTFAPVKTENLAAHRMHEERFEVCARTACAVNEAKATGRRVVAVGTTVARLLESVAAQNDGRIVAGTGRTRLFIHPPRAFGVVDALLTNFHLPRSTLLMLVSAFASPGQKRGREVILAAYAEAIGAGYRFFSYGDAMLIV